MWVKTGASDYEELATITKLPTAAVVAKTKTKKRGAKESSGDDEEDKVSREC